MELTREEALRLHRQMWTDMQMELGDDPPWYKRSEYKQKWCMEHFPIQNICNDCFLCEYMGDVDDCTKVCPIKWDGGCFSGRVTYFESPISEILALPEREEEND